MTPPYQCSGCDKRWGGYGTCHCSYCHHTFTVLAAFDKHRSYGKCLDPESVLDKQGNRALALSNREYPCWSQAGDRPDFWEN